MNWTDLLFPSELTDTLIFISNFMYVSIVISVLLSSAVMLFLLLLNFRRLRSFRFPFRVARSVYVVGIPFAIVGMITGYMTGISREPAVAAVVPSALTLVGGLIAYMIAVNSRQKLAATVIVLNFSVTLLGGSFIGATKRVEQETNLNSFEHRKAQIEKEFRLNRIRKALGVEKRTEIK